MTGRVCTKCCRRRDWDQYSLQSNGLNGRTSVCKKCRSRISKEYYNTNKHKILTDEKRAAAAIAGRAMRLRLRREVMDVYGGRCQCCGEGTFEFLVLDHIFGGGEAHRASIGARTPGHAFYAKLKRMGYPFKDQLRVLCCNCNSSRGYYGYCPHKPKERRKR